MARINLLPWREELRAERQQIFYVHFGIAFAAAAIAVIATNTYVARLTDQQVERNNYLKSEIAKVELEIKEIESLQEQKERLLKRTEVIEQLQQTRAVQVHLFDEMVDATPQGVYLLEIKGKGTELEIRGVSESSGAVSDFMRRIEASVYMGNPRLVIIENKDRGKEKRREFTLRASITPPTPEGADAATTAATAPGRKA
jgi:type IV pilus assembly protein PilN